MKQAHDSPHGEKLKIDKGALIGRGGQAIVEEDISVIRLADEREIHVLVGGVGHLAKEGR